MTVLWRPTGPHELALVAELNWQAWPPRLPGQPIFYPVLNRWYATRITREWNVPRAGVAYVTRFEVRDSFLGAYPVQQVGGRDVLEYWIPAEELPAFNSNMVGCIELIAEYRGPVSNVDTRLPAAWVAYLQKPSWFRRGRLESGTWLELYRPDETWDRSVSPRATIIGSSDGDLVVDTMEPESRVRRNGEVVAETLAAFLAAVEAGTFRG